MPASETYGVFYEHPQLDGQHFFDTKEKRYNDVVMVEVFIMGSGTASISKPVYDKDNNPIVADDGQTYIEKYPKAWAAFTRQGGAEIDGTLLRNLGGIGPGQIKNLNAMGIDTIEELAELGDAVVIGEQGMLDLRKKAQAYIAAMNPEIAEAEAKEKEEEMQALRLEVAQMKEALENATIPPKRGRPKKT